jgi:cancer susceptibility candidate protein 1
MSKKKAAAEKAKLEAVLKAAGDDAKRLYVTHEKERRALEQHDKATADFEEFDRVRERQRLQAERADYAQVEAEISDARRTSTVEARKHERWSDIPQCSWLPDVNDEGQITAFLNQWVNEQEDALGMLNDDETVHLWYTPLTTGLGRADEQPVRVDKLVMQRVDTAPLPGFRKKRLDDDLSMTVRVARLADHIALARDTALMRGEARSAAKHTQRLKVVYATVLQTLDRLCATVAHYSDTFYEGEVDDYLQRNVPYTEKNVPLDKNAMALEPPVVRFGMWVQQSNAMRGGRPSVPKEIGFTQIGVQMDGKDNVTRLPTALELVQPHTAIRALQLHFDPFSVLCKPDVPHEWVALDCILIIETLTAVERSERKDNSTWSARVETTERPSLVKNPYPRTKDMAATEELAMKIAFELPKTVVARSKQLAIGRWNPRENRWEQISSAVVAIEAIRKYHFLTRDLTALAVIQEKGFDVPYVNWRITPVASDEVVFHLQGYGGGSDASAERSEIQIVVRNDQCKLVGPDEPELAHIKGRWLSPPALLRLLARAGYNFVLNDVDAETERMAEKDFVVKTRDLEERGYSDIALFASTYAVASSRHNKAGEDPNMALFRLSKARRDPEAEEPFDPNPEDEGLWRSVRYEADRCVLAQFREADEDAVLSAVEGKLTHLNLYKCLEAEHGADEVKSQVNDVNHLLQQGLYKLLSLVRPFTWG